MQTAQPFMLDVAYSISRVPVVVCETFFVTNEPLPDDPPQRMLN